MGIMSKALHWGIGDTENMATVLFWGYLYPRMGVRIVIIGNFSVRSVTLGKRIEFCGHTQKGQGELRVNELGKEDKSLP